MGGEKDFTETNEKSTSFTDKPMDDNFDVSPTPATEEVAAKDNVDDYDSPDSPDYNPPDDCNDEEDDTKPDIANNQDLQPQNETFEQEDVFECNLCQLRKSEIFEVYQHLEEDHEIEGDEEILDKNVTKVVKLPQEEDSTVDLVSSLMTESSDDSGAIHDDNDETNVTNDENKVENDEETLSDKVEINIENENVSSPNGSIDNLDKASDTTQSSTSPFRVDTLEEFKDILNMEERKRKCIVNPELSNSEEFKQLVKKHEEENCDNTDDKDDTLTPETTQDTVPLND